MAVLAWVDAATRGITEYQDAAVYQDEKRVAGPRRRAPGVTPAELAYRAELRPTKANVRRPGCLHCMEGAYH